MSDQFLAYLAEKRAKILKQKQKLEDELSEIDKAEKLYRASGAGPGLTAAPSQKPHIVRKLLTLDHQPSSLGLDEATDIITGDATIKDCIIAVLGAYPDGLTSAQILDLVQKIGLPTLQRTSLSPQLSRLRQAKKINLVNGVWVRVEPASEGGETPPEPNSPA